MLGLLLLVVQGSPSWNPEADIACAKTLLAKLRVRPPYVLEGYREQGGSPLGPHMVSLATSDGVYQISVSGGKPSTVVRGYIGYSQVDLQNQDPIPQDSPEILAACDLYASALKGNGEFDLPRVAPTNKNEITLTLARKFDGKHVYGLNEINVCFQPTSGKLITYGGITPSEPLVTTPKVAVEDVIPVAERAVNDHAVQKPDSRHPTDHWQLTGKRELAYYYRLDMTRLVWVIQYELFEKPKPFSGGIQVIGGPYYSPVGDVLIDASSGQFVAVDEADRFMADPWYKRVGNYLVAHGGWSNGSNKDEPSPEMENVAKSGHSAEEAIQAVDHRLKELHIGREARLLEIYLQKNEGSDAFEWVVSEKVAGGPGVGALVDPQTNKVLSFRTI